MPFMIRKVVEGFHSTLFAYGQTGSGKTFTMEGYKYLPNDRGIQLPQLPPAGSEGGLTLGLVQRCAKLLMEEAQAARAAFDRKITINVSFMQIYNEKIYDLLNGSFFRRKPGVGASGGQDPPGLKLKWNHYDVYTVENLFTYEVSSYEQVLALFHLGLKNKIIGTHKLNASSSRSHSVLTFTLEQEERHAPDNLLLSKLQLVDLAGSERQALT